MVSLIYCVVLVTFLWIGQNTHRRNSLAPNKKDVMISSTIRKSHQLENKVKNYMDVYTSVVSQDELDTGLELANVGLSGHC